MFSKILVATDGSNHAHQAMSIAADLAGKYDAELVVLHTMMHGNAPPGFADMVRVEHLADKKPDVVPEVLNIPSGLAASLRHVEANADERRYFEFVGEKILEEAKAAARKAGARKIETVGLGGDAANDIVDYARDHAVDLIVIGSRGLGNLKGLLMGSVSHKVSQLATCPCLTVK